MASMEPAQELIEVVTALRNANDALLDATTSGDVAEATRLLQGITVLERRRNRLVHKSHRRGTVSAAAERQKKKKKKKNNKQCATYC